MSQKSALALVWKTAVQEAYDRRLGEILPEHFVIAILRVSELTFETISVLVSNDDMAYYINSEREFIQDSLAKHGINIQDSIKQLRLELGKGNSYKRRKNIHRSPECYIYFEWLRESSYAMGIEDSALGLLHMFLQHSTPVMTKLWGEGIEYKTKPFDTPLMKRWGTLLKEKYRGRKKHPDYAFSFASRVMYQVLKETPAGSIFLITDNITDYEKTIEYLWEDIKHDSFGPYFSSRIRYIVEVNMMEFQRESKEEFNSEFMALLCEASNKEGLVLVFDYETVHRLDFGSLQKALAFISEKSMQVIIPLSRRYYLALINTDESLKKRFHLIWVVLIKPLPDSYTYLNNNLFTDNAVDLLKTANDIALYSNWQEINVEALFTAICNDQNTLGMLCDCLPGAIELIESCQNSSSIVLKSEIVLPFSEEVYKILYTSRRLALYYPDLHYPGLIDSQRLVCAICTSEAVCNIFGAETFYISSCIAKLKEWEYALN